MADRPRTREVAHPTPLTYLKVAATLAILTGIEVAVFYVDALEPAFLPIFLILSVAKFALVVMFYMHLKFDARLFSGVFVGGLLLAIGVAITVMALFQVLSAKSNPPEEEGGEKAAVLEGPTITIGSISARLLPLPLTGRAHGGRRSELPLRHPFPVPRIPHHRLPGVTL